eukprot:gnl/TRDRNA2_/TRDRNA2_91617_c0_seq1.p1 gnl/TRDRNA2_/TRDRNA2_91617_c0~~gnl/TRDRNA2_/TRDRNA2_91617_c0_seq1.p1  ORF type:complete len:340 (+),score=42.66 gnl/TRDRNA2_/TRDRNA2_91617_c0_seq1:25-1044(+)
MRHSVAVLALLVQADASARELSTGLSDRARATWGVQRLGLDNTMLGKESAVPSCCICQGCNGCTSVTSSYTSRRLAAAVVTAAPAATVTAVAPPETAMPARKDCCGHCESLGVALDEQDASAWVKLGDAGGGQVAGIHYSPQECFRNALRLDINHSIAWNKVGAVGGVELNGTHFGKKDCFVKALEQDLRYADAWNNLGMEGGSLIEGIQFFNDELECFRRATSLDPLNALAWYNMGAVGQLTSLVLSGRSIRKVCFEKCLHLDATYVPAWESLGYLGGGEVNGTRFTAQECFQKANVSGPPSDDEASAQLKFEPIDMVAESQRLLRQMAENSSMQEGR